MQSNKVEMESEEEWLDHHNQKLDVDHQKYQKELNN
jgi:hypothetical protein